MAPLVRAAAAAAAAKVDGCMDGEQRSVHGGADKETSIKSKRLSLPVAIKARQQETPHLSPISQISCTGLPQIVNLPPAPSSPLARDWTFSPRILQSSAGQFRLEPRMKYQEVGSMSWRARPAIRIS